MTDPNAVRRRCKILKSYNITQSKIEKEIEKIQRKIDSIQWNKETIIYRIRLYKELGEVIEIFRNNRIRIEWYSKELLKVNLTG